MKEATNILSDMKNLLTLGNSVSLGEVVRFMMQFVTPQYQDCRYYVFIC